jgi:hypothetical protein
MNKEMKWGLPAPPPRYVVSVRDADGHEWERADEAGMSWRCGSVVQTWDWLIYNRGPLTAERLAP